MDIDTTMLPGNPPGNKTQQNKRFVQLHGALGFMRGKSLHYNRSSARDPLTRRAYFDAQCLDRYLVAPEMERRRFFNRRHEPEFVARIHRDMVVIKKRSVIGALSPTNGGGGTRGDVVGFSRASRKRMMEFMMKARFDGALLFATMTYPDHFPIEPLQWKKDFEALRRRFERRYPQYRAIWRIEKKERLTGDMKGFEAPHFHLLVFTGDTYRYSLHEKHIQDRYRNDRTKLVSSLSESFEEWLLDGWHDIAGNSNEDHAKHGAFVVHCRNVRHAMKYVSKYIAKEENDHDAIGRRWGRIGKFDTGYSLEVELTQSEMIALRRILAGWMKSKSKKYAKRLKRSFSGVGFSVFGMGDGIKDENASCPDGIPIRRALIHAFELVLDTPNINWKTGEVLQ